MAKNNNNRTVIVVVLVIIIVLLAKDKIGLSRAASPGSVDFNVWREQTSSDFTNEVLLLNFNDGTLNSSADGHPFGYSVNGEFVPGKYDDSWIGSSQVQSFSNNASFLEICKSGGSCLVSWWQNTTSAFQIVNLVDFSELNIWVASGNINIYMIGESADEADCNFVNSYPDSIITLVFNTTADTVSLYVDGVFVESKTSVDCGSADNFSTILSDMDFSNSYSIIGENSMPAIDDLIIIDAITSLNFITEEPAPPPVQQEGGGGGGADTFFAEEEKKVESGEKEAEPETPVMRNTLIMLLIGLFLIFLLRMRKRKK